MRPDPLAPGPLEPTAQPQLRFDLAPSEADRVSAVLDARFSRAASPRVEATSLWDTESAEDYREGAMLAVIAGRGGRWWHRRDPSEPRSDDWMPISALSRRLDDPTGFAAVRVPVAQLRQRIETWEGEVRGRPIRVELGSAVGFPALARRLRLSGPPNAREALQALVGGLGENSSLGPASTRVDHLVRTLPDQAIQALAERRPRGRFTRSERWRASHDLNYLLSRQRSSEAVVLRRAARRMGAERLDELLREGDECTWRLRHPLWRQALEAVWTEGDAAPWEPCVIESLRTWRHDHSIGPPECVPARLQAQVVMLSLRARRSGSKRWKPLLDLLVELANQAARWQRWRALDAALVDLAASEPLRGETAAVLSLGGLRHRLRDRVRPTREGFDASLREWRGRRWKKLRRAFPDLDAAFETRT